MIINLSREGVFPVSVGLRGEMLTTKTGLALSGTIQGEGKLSGVPSLFVRLQGCNLSCSWVLDGRKVPCDTQHTWQQKAVCPMETSDVERLIMLNIGQMKHVVITGGEPFMQWQAVLDLTNRLHKHGLHVTIESNGSIFQPLLSECVDLLSLSPKLSSSGISDNFRRHTIKSVTAMTSAAIDAGRDFQLKFVVSSSADILEIERDYSSLVVQPSDILLMPLGISAQQLQATSDVALSLAIQHGWRYCPRLHIALFGNTEQT